MTLAEKLNELFNSLEDLDGVESYSILCIREDGIILNSKKSENSVCDNDENEGALIAGAWQALKAVNFSKEQRVIIDEIGAGKIIYEIENEWLPFIFVVTYQGGVNPGKIRNEVKKIKTTIESELNNVDSSKINVKSDTESDFLFENITNDEIDKLFNFVGV